MESERTVAFLYNKLLKIKYFRMEYEYPPNVHEFAFAIGKWQLL